MLSENCWCCRGWDRKLLTVFFFSP